MERQRLANDEFLRAEMELQAKLAREAQIRAEEAAKQERLKNQKKAAVLKYRAPQPLNGHRSIARFFTFGLHRSKS